MNRTPWALWDLASGEPAAGADTEEARQVLERGMERRANTGAPPHPGLLHMYIHLLEMSPFPEQLCSPVISCEAWCRIPAICSTWRRISTCCAAII